jgi:hypothetical protein
MEEPQTMLANAVLDSYYQTYSLTLVAGQRTAVDR